jgi:UDP-N-acetylmuramoylalanine--D-glutamate ligase
VVSELVAAGAVDPARQRVATTVEHAVQLAAEWRDRGVRVVLSPGAPSFPRFRDFEERGERFRQAVAALTGRG